MSNDSHLRDAVAKVGTPETIDRRSYDPGPATRPGGAGFLEISSEPAQGRKAAGADSPPFPGTASYHGHFHVLDSLSAETRRHILALCDEVYLDRGEILWNQGDLNTGFGVVRKGIVAGIYNSPTGKTGLSGFWRDGDAIGTSSGSTRMLTAMALTGASVLTIEREMFFEAVRTYPDFAEAAVNMAFERLTWLGELIFSHETQSTTQRVATILLAMLDCFGRPMRHGMVIDAPLTNDMLAALVGASRQFINGILHKLQDEQVLRLRRSSIVVVDRKRLESLLS